MENVSQGTFLPSAVAADLDAMAAHDALNGAAAAIRDRMTALKAQGDAEASSAGEAGRRRSLQRSASLTAAERHMSDFRRIVKARAPIQCPLPVLRLSCSRTDSDTPNEIHASSAWIVEWLIGCI